MKDALRVEELRNVHRKWEVRGSLNCMKLGKVAPYAMLRTYLTVTSYVPISNSADRFSASKKALVVRVLAISENTIRYRTFMRHVEFQTYASSTFPHSCTEVTTLLASSSTFAAPVQSL